MVPGISSRTRSEFDIECGAGNRPAEIQKTIDLTWLKRGTSDRTEDRDPRVIQTLKVTYNTT